MNTFAEKKPAEKHWSSWVGINLLKNKRAGINFLLLVFLVGIYAIQVQAATRYVATPQSNPAGSDTSGDGTISKPYATISKALSVSSHGDLVSIGSGIYSSGQLLIPEGVSLTSSEQDKSKVVIRPQIEMGSNFPLLYLVSTALDSNGGQSISHITIDGRGTSVKAIAGIEVRNRNNVSIHDCTISNFYSDTVMPWNQLFALKVWSKEVEPTSSYVYYYSLFNNDLSKSNNYPTKPVRNFQFFNNKVIHCGAGAPDGDRKFNAAIVPWHLYGSSFHDNYIDVSHVRTQAITCTSALLEKVDIYNNVILGHSSGCFQKSTTESKSLYLVELWVLHDCKFYNNKLIRGGFSTCFGKNVEWYYNYIDTSSAEAPVGYLIEASYINNASVHHNKFVGNKIAGENFGIVVGIEADEPRVYLAAGYVYYNILHDIRAHVISFSSSPSSTVEVYGYNNLVDHAMLWYGMAMWNIKYAELKNNIVTYVNQQGVYANKPNPAFVIDNNILFGNTNNFYNCSGTNTIFKEPTYDDYAKDSFRIKESASAQVDSGVSLDPAYQMGFSPSTDWGTATSEDLPKIRLTDQSQCGLRWEAGPYVWETPGTPPSAPGGLMAW